MDLLIRQATPEDAPYIAPLIYDAIGDIAKRLTGEQEDAKIIETLTELVARDNNRHSYLYTYIAENAEHLLGIAVLYDGKSGKKLDLQLQQFLQEKLGSAPTIDVEAHDDEYYIDTICVTEEARGQGIGTQLLQFAEQMACIKKYNKLSLNVELQKEQARKLYERIGFTITEPWTLIGEPFHHMVKYLKEQK